MECARLKDIGPLQLMSENLTKTLHYIRDTVQLHCGLLTRRDQDGR